MSDTEWFRFKVWSEENQRVFFGHLSRARSQRDQYIAIQAGSLAKHDPDATLELADLYFETRTEDFHDNIVHVHCAEAHLKKGDVVAAIEAYTNALQREKEFPNSLSQAAFDFALLVAELDLKSEFHSALSALEFADREELKLFPSDVFKWHAAHALIACSENRPQDAGAHAARALEAKEQTNSGIRNHPNLGLVREFDEGLLTKLVSLVEQ